MNFGGLPIFKHKNLNFGRILQPLIYDLGCWNFWYVFFSHLFTPFLAYVDIPTIEINKKVFEGPSYWPTRSADCVNYFLLSYVKKYLYDRGYRCFDDLHQRIEWLWQEITKQKLKWNNGKIWTTTKRNISNKGLRVRVYVIIIFSLK